jgi:hypothetical protein
VERLAANDGLKDAVVSIDAIATNARVATAIRDGGAHYLLAVKDNQPTLRAEIESFFASAPAAALESVTDVDKGHGALSKEPSRWLARSTGSTAIVASLASFGCRRSQRWCGSQRAPNSRIAAVLGRALLIFDLGVASTQRHSPSLRISNRTGGLRAARHHQLAWHSWPSSPWRA